MAGRYWNTLGVEDIERARAFYEALGFVVRDAPGGATCITVHPDEATTICLFSRNVFAGMVPSGICDTSKAHELVQSYAADSRDEVDALVAKAEQAGGRAFGGAKDEPWMYGRGFSDPDGHVWAVLHMPGAPA